MSILIMKLLEFLTGFIDTYVPTLEIPETVFSNMVVGVSGIVKMLVAINFVFPVDTFLIPIGVIAVVKLSMIGFWVVNWVYNKITQLIP